MTTQQTKALPTITQQAEAIQTAWTYLTVKQFCDKHKAFAIGGIRALIFNEHENGLAKSGAVVRMGRKILLSEPRFFEWLEASQGGK